MPREWIRIGLGHGLWLADLKDSADGPLPVSVEDEVLAVLVLGAGEDRSAAELQMAWWGSAPAACVGPAPAGTVSSVPSFSQISSAVCFLALESGGDNERAAAWLDLAASYLGDLAVLVPASMDLSVSFLSDDLAVLSVPSVLAPDVNGLSLAETNVFHGLVRGYSNKEIASSRGSAYSTVARQVAAVFRKLGVQSRSELMAAYGWSVGDP